MKEENVHALKYREAKEPQGGADRLLADLFRLDGRTIVITGGSGFVGIEVAITVLQSGGHVLSLDLVQSPKPDEWEKVIATAKAHGGEATYFACDVTDEAGIQKIFTQFKPKCPIRGLVACAGVSMNGPSLDFPAASFKRLLDINVAGTFTIAQACARSIHETSQSGSFVFIASMSGHVSNKGVDTAAYNSSKAAIHQLARSLAAEWGSRVGMPLIRVNSVSPGYIRTAATAEALQKPGMESQWIGDNMLYRLSTVDEFRAPILFLLGDGSSFVTGADLRVDGGHCAW